MSSDPQVSPWACRFSSSVLLQALTQEVSAYFLSRGIEGSVPSGGTFGLELKREKNPTRLAAYLVVGNETLLPSH